MSLWAFARLPPTTIRELHRLRPVSTGHRCVARFSTFVHRCFVRFFFIFLLRMMFLFSSLESMAAPPVIADLRQILNPADSNSTRTRGRTTLLVAGTPLPPVEYGLSEEPLSPSSPRLSAPVRPDSDGAIPAQSKTPVSPSLVLVSAPLPGVPPDPSAPPAHRQNSASTTPTTSSLDAVVV